MITKKRIIKIAEKAVQKSFKDGKIQEKVVEQFSSEFSKLPKAEAIPFLSAYHKGIKRELDKQTLLIETALPIPSSIITQIEKEIKTNHRVTSIVERVNPGLLGGIKIKIADEVFEGTLLRQIEELGNHIKNG